MSEIIIGFGALEKRLGAIESPAVRRQYLGRVGLAVVREAKYLVQAHSKTRNTSRSIVLGTVTEDSVTVEAGGAAVYLESGTKPHIIRPVRAKALRFAASSAGRRLTGSARKGAAVVFAKFVRHPGTQATPFMVPAGRRVLERFDHADELVIKPWNNAA